MRGGVSSGTLPGGGIAAGVAVAAWALVGPVAGAESNPHASGGWFARGATSAVPYVAFVVPVDMQRGVALAPTGDNAGRFGGAKPWPSRIDRFAVTNLQHGGTGPPLAVQNPLAAFGGGAAGTRLMTGRSYAFGLYAGAHPTNSLASIPSLRIAAYRKSDFASPGATGIAPVTSATVSVPVPPYRGGTNFAEWAAFAAADFAKSFEVCGLRSTLRLVEGGYLPPKQTEAEAILPSSWAFDQAYGMEHVASSDEYYYLIELKGYLPVSGEPPMIATAGGAAQYYPLYGLDFESRPPWTCELVDRPSFQAEPVPPRYRGKAPEELLSERAEVPGFAAAPVPAQCLGLDASPDLRAHPEIDGLVADLGGGDPERDAMAFANFVLNEIELTDPVSYHDDGAYDSRSINAGGVCRNALAVYREGQGNPAEICSLLVYMLRKAGIPAVYAFPAPNSLKMLDERVSELLRVQIVGALDLLGNEELAGLPAAMTNQVSGRIPALVPVNYPWVAAHVPVAAQGGTNRWVHIFPWMADTEMREGGDLYDHIRPADAGDTDGVGSAMEWVRRYISADTNLLSLAEDNVPAALFPEYVRRRLARNHPGVSIDDIGIRHRNRRHSFTSWEEFPAPFSVSAAPGCRTNLAEIADIFDTLEIEILDPTETVVTNTGPMRLCDIHDRRLVVRYDKVNPAADGVHSDGDPIPNPPGQDDWGIGAAYNGGHADDTATFQNNYVLGPYPPGGTYIYPEVKYHVDLIEGGSEFDVREGDGEERDFGETVDVTLRFNAPSTNGWYNGRLKIEVRTTDGNIEVDRMYYDLYGYSSEDPDSTLTVSLASFRDSASGTNGFGGLANPLLTAQRVAVAVPNDHGGHYIRARQSWHRNYTGGLWVEPFLNVYSKRSAEYTGTMHRGSMAAVCLNYGRVTPRMLRPHAEEFWRMQRGLDADPSWKPPRDLYQGTPAYLMGMTSFESMGRFDALNQGLHKFRMLSSRMLGFYQLRAYAPGGAFPPGEYQMVEPGIDFAYSWAALAQSGAAHMESGDVLSEAIRDYSDLFVADGSAHEHSSIDRFFRDDSAISTVKLLQIAAQNTNAPVELTRENYASAGTNFYAGLRLDAHDPGMWSSIAGTFNATPADGAQFTKVFVTPGSQEGGNDGAGGTSYRGMGALVMGKFFRAGWISDDQKLDNGGRGGHLDPLALAGGNVVNLALEPYPDFGFYLDATGGPSASDPAMLPSLYADYDTVRIAEGADAGFYHFSETDMGWRAAAAGALGLDWGLGMGDTLIESANRGMLAGTPSWFRDGLKLALDPVHVVTGEFYHDAVDLALPGPMPLSIRRNYSSQNPADNQFGAGWKLAHMPFLSVAAGETNIWAAEPDGSVLSYRRQGGQDVWRAGPEDNPNLNNVAGGLGNLAEARIERAGGGGPGTVYRLTTPDGAARTFTVRSYPIGTGTNLIQRTRPYLDSWRDPNGNTYAFHYYTNGALPEYGQLRRIEAANGNFIGLYYDVAGHITEAYAGDGRRVKYRYDDYGDLVEVTLPDGAVHAYAYGHRTGSNGIYSTHLLVREDKPEGNVLENTYDSLRRVTEQRATVGEDGALVRNGTFVYQNATNADGTASGCTLVIDAYDRTNRYEYEHGQFTRIEDAAGNVTLMDWYSVGDPRAGAYPRSLASRTDPRGLVTEYRYDSRGNPTNVLARGDLTGDGSSAEATTSATFETNNVPLLVTEPSGHYTTFAYGDTNYPLLATFVQRLAPGGTPVASASNAYTRVDGPNGPIGGLLQKTIRDPGSANPAVTDFTYNDEGFVSGTTQYPGTGDPDVALAFRRNLRDEVVERRDAAGRRVNFSYDDMGRPTGTEYREASGALIGWRYDYFDGNGKKTWSDGPRWFPEDYVWRKFDRAGRPLEEARWRSRAKADASGAEAPTGEDLWASTFFSHDLFGNLRSIVDPNRNLTEMDYDAIGRMTARRVYQGTSGSQILSGESFGYGPGGEIAVHTNALGGVTRMLYTATGKLKERHNPDGTTEYWRYLPDGRLARETHKNGSYLDYGYQDATRTVTRTLYSSTGGFLAGDSQTFDSRGNAISETDREGNTWLRTYDGLDRPRTVAGPDPGGDSDPQSTTNFYDAAGITSIVQNGLGERTVTIRDAMGRTTSVEVKDPSGATVRRTGYAYRPDHHGVTVTEGSGPGAISVSTLTDTAGNTVARKWSDGAFETWDFDPAGNPVAHHDPLDRTTTYAHDALGRRTFEHLPDGAATTFLHDGLGNLTARILPGGLTETNTFDPAGRLLTSMLVSGAQTSRAVSRAYYGSGNGAGQLASWTDARNVHCELAYDAFGRPQTETYSGPQSLTRTLAYDDRGLATGIAESSPAATTEISRSFDPYGQIASESVALDGNALSSIAQTWDGAGRRKSLAPAGGPAFAYAHRADGVLSNVTVNGSSYRFVYGDNGMLASRSGPARNETIIRDGRGRISERWYDAALGGQLYWEGTGWNADDTLWGYGLWGYAAGECTWHYDNDARRRLVQEEVDLGTLHRWRHLFDESPAPQLNVRTYSDWIYSTNAVTWYYGWKNLSDLPDALGRIGSSAVLGDKIPVTVAGESLGAGRVKASLAGVNLGEAAIREAWDDDGSWRLPHPQLVRAGNGYQMVASATHPSDHFTAWATNTFNVSWLQPTITMDHDPMGNMATRAWSGIGNGNRTQTFTWDARGRLMKAAQRDGSNDGFDLECVYDGLGRRIRAIERAVVDDAPDANSAVVTDSVFDPEVEFLEIAVWCGWEHGGGATRLVDPENEGWTWKVYGPDLDGIFGGLQGIGGLEAIVTPTATVSPFHDLFGNIVAYMPDATHLNWGHIAEYSAFGLRPDNVVPSLLPGMPLHEVLNYRGKRLDPTGDYWWGARYYDPVQGQFTSHDPMGYLDGSNPYGFCLNNPLVWQDADGRFSVEALRQANGWIAAADDFGLNMFLGGGALASFTLDWGMTAALGGGWMGGGTHLHAQGDAFMAAMNPLQQFGYYQPGSYEAQARNAAELVAVAAGGGAALNKLASIGDDLIRLGSNFKLPEFSLTFETRMGGRQMNPSQAGMLDLSTATSNTPKLFDVIPYSTAAPGFERHHGVLDAWARANVSGYSGSTSPTMVLTAEMHNATRAVFNTWRAERGMARQAIDWTRVSAQEAHSLSYRMFRAAGAPDEAVETYFRAFNRHLYGN